MVTISRFNLLILSSIRLFHCFFAPIALYNRPRNNAKNFGGHYVPRPNIFEGHCLSVYEGKIHIFSFFVAAIFLYQNVLHTPCFKHLISGDIRGQVISFQKISRDMMSPIKFFLRDICIFSRDIVPCPALISRPVLGEFWAILGIFRVK